MNEKILAVKSVEKGLDHVQKLCRVRTISLENIEDVLSDVASVFSVKGKYYKGFKVHIDYHAQTFAKSYRGRPESTHFTATYTGSAWRIEHIWRDTCTTHKCIPYALNLDQMNTIITNIGKRV